MLPPGRCAAHLPSRHQMFARVHPAFLRVLTRFVIHRSYNSHVLDREAAGGLPMLLGLSRKVLR